MDLLVHQVEAFAATILIGMAAGFCYDYYRVVRGVFRLKKVGTFLGDIIFWLLTTALVFVLLLRGNWGEVRLYVFVGLSLGAFLYYRLFSVQFSRLVRLKFYLFQKTWELLVKLVLLIWTVILFPFRLLLLLLSYPLDFLEGLRRKAGRKGKAVLYNLVGRRVERSVARVKSKLAPLAFWKNKKDG